MSEKDTTETLAHHEVSELAALARQAYDQKRTKDCLDLTRAILLIDPDNADALQIRSSIQSRMQHDLENARAILRQRQVDLGPAQQPESNDAGDTELEAIPVPPPAEILPGRGKRLSAYVLIVVAIMLAVTAFAVPAFRNTANRAQPPAPPLNTAATPQPTVPAPLDPAPVL